MQSKSEKIMKFFIANPDTPVKDVAKKFKANVTWVYQLRKRAFAAVETLAFPPEEETEEIIAANARQVGGDHYKEMGIEPWDVVDTWPLEQRIGAYRFGLLKYTMRMGRKGSTVEDANKAHHYAQKLIEVFGDGE